MPKKKTGQRKKAEKQKARQKELGDKRKLILSQDSPEIYPANIKQNSHKVFENTNNIYYLQETNAQQPNSLVMPIWIVISVKENKKIEPFAISVKVSKGKLYIFMGSQVSVRF